MDPYEVLDIDRSASQEAIKKQFRRLSMKHHPDRNRNSAASNEAFQRITAAYSKIDTPEKRNAIANKGVPDELYKFFMETHLQNNMHDIKRQTGREESVGLSMKKPPPIVRTITIPFELSYSGGQVPLRIERQIKNDSFIEKETETIYVQVQQGTDENEMIIIRGKGNIVDSEKGDIKVFVKIEDHPVFTRSGLNLVYDHKITLRQSLCGFSLSIPYIDGKTLNIHNKSGTIIKPGYQKTIAGYGFKRDSHTGSLIVRFEIEFPEALEPETIQAISSILP